MRIIHLSQEDDREAWLEERRGKITGAKNNVGYQARNKTKRYAEFYTVLAEKLSIARDGEDVRDRGHRLEKEALAKLGPKLGLEFNDDAGMWVSDVDDDIAVSPDGAEPLTDAHPLPTYAAEVKALESSLHIRFILEHRQRKILPGYNPIQDVPNEERHQYRDQVLQYFVVNEALERLYFVLYDDRIVFEHLTMLVIEINRADVADLIRERMAVEYEALQQINKLVKQLSEEQ